MPHALIVLSAIMTILYLTSVLLNSTAITVTLRHKQMCQPLKFALVNVSPGSLDLQPANRRFAICCDQRCMPLPLESRSCKYESDFTQLICFGFSCQRMRAHFDTTQLSMNSFPGKSCRNYCASLFLLHDIIYCCLSMFIGCQLS